MILQIVIIYDIQLYNNWVIYKYTLKLILMMFDARVIIVCSGKSIGLPSKLNCKFDYYSITVRTADTPKFILMLGSCKYPAQSFSQLFSLTFLRTI